MIRKMLEAAGFSFTDDQFKDVMRDATDDIKFKRIVFKKKTSINGMIKIAEMCSVVPERSMEVNENGCKS